jgi:hypothetical protein
MAVSSKIGSLLKATRSQDWWGNKLPPLLAIGYATALQGGVPLLEIAPKLLISLGAIIIGAVYVSLINDITDIEVDLASGKKNKMANLSPKIRWVIPILCILAGLGFIYTIADDQLSVILYTLPWISFSLYSLHPFRLKTRGLWGVFADACGAHLFISLFIVTSVSYYINQQIDWIWFCAIGIWALMYGLRGILWHQFTDRENDIEAKVTTFASKVDPLNFYKKTLLIMAFELAALLVIMQRIAGLFTLLFTFLYILHTVYRLTQRNQKIVIVLAPENQPYQMLMMDYYQFFLPISLLLTGAFIHSTDFLLLALQLFLFPQNTLLVYYDLKKFVKISFRKVLSVVKA